jgi:hypothetical protein
MALNNSSGEVHTLDLFQRHVCLDRRAASAQNKTNPNERVARRRRPQSRYFSRASPPERNSSAEGADRAVCVCRLSVDGDGLRECLHVYSFCVGCLNERVPPVIRPSLMGEHTRPSAAAVLNRVIVSY